MIWIWLATRHRFKWATGPLDNYFAFLCAHCGISTAAMVRSLGFGSGSSQMAAEQSARVSANALAHGAVLAASCPHCNALQPTIHEGFARASKKAARYKAVRLPLAAVATILIVIAIGIPAVADLHHSVTLSIVATSTATAVGALLFALFAGAVKTPNTNPTGVWFSRDPSQGPGSWFAAQPGQVPFVAQPERMLRVLSLVTMGISTVAALVAVVLWSQTFRKVYVVSSEGAGRDLIVRVDGGPARSVSQQSSEDAPSLMLEVRTDTSHEVVVQGQGEDGKQTTYTLDPATAAHGWVLAPRGRQHGLCLASITWYYGTKPKDGDDSVLGESDLVVLPRSFDHIFTPPPATVQTQNGSSTTRTSLRALDCAALDRDQIVAFKDGHRRVANPDDH